MKILVDNSGGMQIVDIENDKELELHTSGEISFFSPFPNAILKEAGGMFDKVVSFSNEPEEFKKSLLTSKND